MSTPGSAKGPRSQRLSPASDLLRPPLADLSLCAPSSWVMYEKPQFHGRKCVLAEGDVEISNPWAAYQRAGEAPENVPFRIGSFKRVVQVSASLGRDRSLKDLSRPPKTWPAPLQVSSSGLSPPPHEGASEG